MSLDLSGYELCWPTALFASEGRRVLQSGTSAWEERAKWLLTEALVGTTAVADFDEALSGPIFADDDPWATGPSVRVTGPTRREWFTELIERVPELRHASAVSPYWPQRHGRGLSHDGSTRRDTRRDFTRIIDELTENGYLVEAFGEECVDDPSEMPDASLVIERRLGIPGLWPLQPETWDEDAFFGLIEVFHDLVSRPRARHFHSYNACGWHHSEFHNGPARTLYRWKVNELLAEAGIGYELAAEGEDLGRLVAVTDDARRELVHRVLNEGAPDIAERTRHAISLFRARDAKAESKILLAKWC